MAVDRRRALGLCSACCAGCIQWVGGSAPDEDTLDDDIAAHGDVELLFLRSPSEPDDPFVGTAELFVRLDHLDCFVDFYEENPMWAQPGDRGGPVFDAFADLLCERSSVECSVITIDHAVGEAHHVEVTYAVEGNLDGRTISVGPFPGAELANCWPDEPDIRIGTTSAIEGRDAAGNVVWETVTLSDDRAAVDQSQPIRVWAARATSDH